MRVADPAYRVEHDGDVVRLVGPSDLAYENAVVYARLADDAAADGAIRRQLAYFGALARDFEWKHFDHDPPAGLAEVLERHGFRRGEPETLMVLDVASAVVDHRATAFEVREVGADGLADAMRVQREVAGQDYPWLEPSLRRELVHAGDLSIHVGYVKETPVAAGWMRCGTAFASIHGGAVLPAWRGRGAYRAVLASRVARARVRGIRYIVSDSTAMSRPRLARMGFVELGRTTPFVFAGRL